MQDGHGSYQEASQEHVSAELFVSAEAHLWAELAGYLLLVLPPTPHCSHAAVLELAKLEGFGVSPESHLFPCRYAENNVMRRRMPRWCVSEESSL